MSVKALFLDLDGTLHDFEPAAIDAMEIVYARIVERYPRVSRASLEREYGAIWKIAREHVFSDGKTSVESRTERFGLLLSRFGINDRELIDELVKGYSRAYAERVRPFDRAVEEMERLRESFDLYVVTDGSDGQRTVVESLGIAAFLKDIYTARDSRSGKQGGGLFRYALEKSGLAPDEAITVGDSYERDIKGAEAAGIRSVWVNRDGLAPGAPCPTLIAVIRDIRGLGDAMKRAGITPDKPF